MSPETIEAANKPEKEKLPTMVMAGCAWPLGLAGVGGLLGGLFGGLAFAVNIALYRSSLPRWSLWLLNPLVGLIAVVLWLGIGILVSTAIQSSN